MHGHGVCQLVLYLIHNIKVEIIIIQCTIYTTSEKRLIYNTSRFLVYKSATFMLPLRKELLIHS